MSDQRQWVELDPTNGTGTPAAEAADEKAVVPRPDAVEPAAPPDSNEHGG